MSGVQERSIGADGYTFVQRMLRPVVRWLVERFFPQHMFWGHEAVEPFAELERRRNEAGDLSCSGNLAAMYLINLCSDLDGIKYDVEATDVSIHEKNLGDWRVTVEKIG